MKIFVIRCYNRTDDAWPCLVMSYKNKRKAVKRADKAKLTFPKVEILITEN